MLKNEWFESRSLSERWWPQKGSRPITMNRKRREWVDLRWKRQSVDTGKNFLNKKNKLCQWLRIHNASSKDMFWPTASARPSAIPKDCAMCLAFLCLVEGYYSSNIHRRCSSEAVIIALGSFMPWAIVHRHRPTMRDNRPLKTWKIALTLSLRMMISRPRGPDFPRAGVVLRKFS